MKICIYPGTFDPVTHGHLDVLARAARLFDRVVVAVAENKQKRPLFSAEDRVSMIEENLRAFPNVSVCVFDGLLVEFARKQGAVAIIRGLRALADFEYEFQMALMNRHLEEEVETLFVMTKHAYSYTSSHLVKQVGRLGADVSSFVPPNVEAALKRLAAEGKL
jgi:pantetheine-phosphate adenylyltransferase